MSGGLCHYRNGVCCDYLGCAAGRCSDEKTIRILNNATMILAFSEQMSLEAVFEHLSNEMDHFVTMNMLDSKPELAQKGLSFVWNSDPNILKRCFLLSNQIVF